jgi:simple sugar transport system ATP-binding protein
MVVVTPIASVLLTMLIGVVVFDALGVDAGAAAAIHQALVDLAGSGSAIVVISQDLDELLSLGDTLAVINEGRLSKPIKIADADINEIGLLMGGIHGDPEATAHTEVHHAA